MNSQWNNVIKHRWGNVHSTSNGTVMRVLTGPDDTDFRAHDYMALVTITPVEKELAVETDRISSVWDDAGSFRLAPSGIHYRSQWKGNCNAIGSAISPERLRTIAGETFENDDVRLNVPKFGVIDPQILLISKLMIDEDKQPFPSALAFEALQTLFWVRLLRQYSAFNPQSSKPHAGGLPPRVQRMIEGFVRENLGEVSLAKMAEVAGLSQSHFLRSFRQTTGQSPHQFVIKCRLERAVRLIQEKQLSLSDVATACGFSSHSHMTYLVRKHWNATPRQLQG